MSRKSAILLTSVACIATALAGPQPLSSSSTTSTSLPADEPMLPGFDFMKASASFSGDMDLSDGPGKLEIFSLSARSILTKPLYPIDNLLVLPMLQYDFTRLDFSGTVPGYPISDEEVHSISLSSFFVYSKSDSPWIYGAWTRAQLATDFQHTDGDDVTFDVVAGVAYKISSTLTVGIGAAAVNLNNDAELYVGFGVDWKPFDTFRLGIYGPNAVVSWTPTENWEFSLRGDASGDEWNIRDAGGNSTTLDLDSYRIGLYADRRLTGDLWLRVGAGATVANEIEYQKTGGQRLYQDDLDNGWFGEIGLRLKTW